MRICRPGGHLYLTNEKNSPCYGSPGDMEIAECYRLVAEVFQVAGMDIECGPAQAGWLHEAGLVQVETIPRIVASDADREGFHAVLQRWEPSFLDTARSVGFGNDALRKMQLGFAAHRRAALQGHAGWPIWSTLARKPS